MGGSHSVGVVLAEVDYGKLPKTSHVGSLEKLTLVGGTVTVHRNGKVFHAFVLLSEGETRADWELGTNDTISTVKVVLFAVVMHRSTLALGGASSSSHHFCHDTVSSVTSGEGLAMDTICRN